MLRRTLNKVSLGEYAREARKNSEKQPEQPASKEIAGEICWPNIYTPCVCVWCVCMTARQTKTQAKERAHRLTTAGVNTTTEAHGQNGTGRGEQVDRERGAPIMASNKPC